MSKQLKNSLLLFLAALIWGVAFVAQSNAMIYIGPFTFTFLRNIIGALVLMPIAILSKGKSENNKTLVIAGIICGAALGTASCLQQYGIVYTTAGKAGFLTALYIIIVPILGLFLKQKCSPAVWIAVVVAIIGVYLLCISESFTLNCGDIFEFLCAIVFAVQIIGISKFSDRINAYWFSCIQFITAAFVAAVPMLVLKETVTWQSVSAAWLPLLYTGVLSSGVGYTLQTIGQRDLNPTVAAIIMSLESCISAIAGWIILGQAMTVREVLGCVIMFIAIIIVQLKRD